VGLPRYRSADSPHSPRSLPTGADWHGRAQALAERTHELVSFLVDVLGATHRATVIGESSCDPGNGKLHG